MEQSVYNTLKKAREQGPHSLNKEEIKLLKENDLDGWTPIGGQAKSDAVADLAAMGALYAGVKTLPIWGPRVARTIFSDWGDRTLSRDVYQEKAQFGIEPKGLEGWRPLNIFKGKAQGGTRHTGPTSRAENVPKALMIHQHE